MKLGAKKTFLAAELLIEPIEVYAPTNVSDGEGGFTVTYGLQGTVWGMYVPEGNDRTLIASEISYTEQARVFVRYPLTINNNYQLGINGNRYSIHSIADMDNLHQYLEIKVYR